MPKNAVNARERDMKIKWLRKHRASVAYLSVVPRPQRVRMMWVNDLEKGKV
jgi:hypothetical protein